MTTITTSKELIFIHLFIVSQDGLHPLSSFDKERITEQVGSLQTYEMILRLQGRNSELQNKEQGHRSETDRLIFKYVIRKAAEQQINVKRPTKLGINEAVFF